ncbi:MAG: hypothetical protein NUV74_05565 [Candidatus Brocadiaceae bacterium]|nr:hypothetical protein [Candidatus Brocadiaceae bacterium]
MSAYLRAVGWQGGTIHQVASELGCDSTALLYGKPNAGPLTSDASSGWFTGRTCGIESIRGAVKTRHGNIDFWLGYARGQCV